MHVKVSEESAKSVWLSVCRQGYLRNHKRDLYQFLCMLPMSVARSSFGMLTIGRIAYRQHAERGLVWYDFRLGQNGLWFETWFAICSSLVDERILQTLTKADYGTATHCLCEICYLASEVWRSSCLYACTDTSAASHAEVFGHFGSTSEVS